MIYVDTSPTNKETLGEKVRRLRKERGLSQEYLAESCSVSFGWVSKIENDKAIPSPELLNKIAHTFKISVSTLLQNNDLQLDISNRIKLIEVLLETGQLFEAEAYLQELDNHPDLSEKDKITLLVLQSDHHYHHKKYDDVLDLLLPLINKFEMENYHDDYTMAWIRNKIGNVYTQKQDTSNAYYNYKKALDHSKRFPVFDQLSAYITYNVGLTLRRKGRLTEATEFLETAGQFFLQNQDLKSFAHTLFVQGLAYKNRQEYDRATELLNQSHNLYQALNHHSLCHEVRLALASTITCRENPTEALHDLELCFEHFVRENDLNGMVFVLSKQASIVLSLREYNRCSALLSKAFDILGGTSHALSHEIADLYATASRYYFEIAEYEKAIELASKSSEIFDILGMVSEHVNSLKVVVDSYKALRDFEKALLYQTMRSDLLETLQKE